jgi:hypothetical protein
MPEKVREIGTEETREEEKRDSPRSVTKVRRVHAVHMIMRALNHSVIEEEGKRYDTRRKIETWVVGARDVGVAELKTLTARREAVDPFHPAALMPR